VPARFFKDDPDTLLPMRWSFVPEKTPGLYWSHAFGSRVWEVGEEDEGPVGELDGPRTWQGGLPPYPLPIVDPLGRGELGICGSMEQWQEGCRTSDPVPPNWPGSFVHRCCAPPPLDGFGGVVLGGPGEIGPCCEGVTIPEIVQVLLTIDFGFCPPLDGIPFLMSQFLGPRPPAMPWATFRSGTYDFGGGSGPQKFYLGCNGDPKWELYLVPDDAPETFMIAGQFVEQECIPFRLWTPAPFIQWPVFFPACDVFFASLLVTAG